MGESSGLLTQDCPGHGFPCSASKGLRGSQPWFKGGQDLLPAEGDLVLSHTMLALQVADCESYRVREGYMNT